MAAAMAMANPDFLTLLFFIVPPVVFGNLGSEARIIRTPQARSVA